MIVLDSRIVDELVSYGYTYEQANTAYLESLNLIEWIIHNKKFNSDVARDRYLRAILLNKLKGDN